MPARRRYTSCGRFVSTRSVHAIAHARADAVVASGIAHSPRAVDTPCGDAFFQRCLTCCLPLVARQRSAHRRNGIPRRARARARRPQAPRQRRARPRASTTSSASRRRDRWQWFLAIDYPNTGTEEPTTKSAPGPIPDENGGRSRIGIRVGHPRQRSRTDDRTGRGLDQGMHRDEGGRHRGTGAQGARGHSGLDRRVGEPRSQSPARLSAAAG